MVKIRENVAFLADFPDDTVYREDGDEAQFAGENVAKTLADMLIARGYGAERPENCYELGWEFDVRRDKSVFTIRVTKIEEFVLVARDRTGRPWADRNAYPTFLQDIHSILSGDPRFSRIWWFEGELPSTEDQGFSNPVDT
jgi:hypothetical protein